MIGALEQGIAWFVPVVGIVVLFVWTDHDTRIRRRQYRRFRQIQRAERRALRSIQ